MQNVSWQALILKMHVALFAGLCMVQNGAAQDGALTRPLPSVILHTVKEEAINPPVDHIARIAALEAVDLRARVPGFIEKISFKPGAYVKDGDLLFTIEPARYDASVIAAKAQVARAEANRHQASNARQRNEELVGRNVVSRVTLEDAQIALDIAEAELAVAHATLSKAELELSYTRISAPISGRISEPELTEGNLVGPESAPLARLVQVDPIRVVFSISEGDIVTFRQAQLEGEKLSRDTVQINLKLPNGQLYSQEGKLEFLGPEVDSRTGTLAVRAIFPNPDGLLMPGQFVQVITRNKDTRIGPVVPQSAVLQDRQGRFVYIADQNNVVWQRRIETGAKTNDQWVVQQGLKAGETIVVQGVQRLSDGMTVQPVVQAGGSPQ